MYAGLSILLYFTGFLSFFICIPLIVAYYVRGYEFCKKSALVFFVIIMIVRIMSMVSLLGNETHISSTYSLLYEVLYCISAIIAVLVLLHSHFIWPLRILIATFILFVSMYIQIRYIQDNLSTVVESSPVFLSMLEYINGMPGVSDTGIANGVAPVFTEQQSIPMLQKLFSTAIFFTWAAAMCIIMFNWFIAIMITRRILGFNIHDYLRYVYTKILSSYSMKMPVILAISACITFLLRNSRETIMTYIYNFFGNVVIVLLLCYMIYGLCAWYFILLRSFARMHAHAAVSTGREQKNLQLRSDWYFFVICGMMIIPLINTAVSALCIVMGIRKNIQYIKNAYAMRSNDESNS